jgi:hypothetical protein
MLDRDRVDCCSLNQSREYPTEQVGRVNCP